MLLFSLHRLEQLLSCFCQLFEDPVLSGLPTRSIIQTNTQFLKMRVQLSTALFLVACGVTSAFAPTATNSVCRNNLNNVPLFMSTEAASLNGADVADVEIPTKLPSDVGMDYVPLATMLATGQLAEADQVRVICFLQQTASGAKFSSLRFMRNKLLRFNWVLIREFLESISVFLCFFLNAWNSASLASGYIIIQFSRIVANMTRKLFYISC